ncbi:head decoration protein [Hyphobacterium sp.]|uniref:head decoration protein n=1 Tax=Hyphobacterium sp. TaxID=2004662 RepID=UPI003B52A332
MSLMVSTATEPTRLSDVIKYELEPSYCRSKRVLLAGSGAIRTVTIGLIVGADASLSVASAAGGGNTGDGTISGVALGEDAVPGIYTLECIAAATDGGTFAVINPDNEAQADAIVGTAYDNDEIAFTINDGAADFVVGDTFTITVTETAGKVAALDLTAADGLNNVAGIVMQNAQAPDGADSNVLILERGPAIVSRDGLTYPSGATSDQKAAIDAALEAKGILVRDAY